MLASVTRKYRDLSTTESFAFAFYCDRCGKEWRSEIYDFNMDEYAKPVDERIRAMVWNEQHDEAYARANLDAQGQFLRCNKCGRRVCGACCAEMIGLCQDCDK